MNGHHDAPWPGFPDSGNGLFLPLQQGAAPLNGCSMNHPAAMSQPGLHGGWNMQQGAYMGGPGVFFPSGEMSGSNKSENTTLAFGSGNMYEGFSASMPMQHQHTQYYPMQHSQGLDMAGPAMASHPSSSQVNSQVNSQVSSDSPMAPNANQAFHQHPAQLQHQHPGLTMPFAPSSMPASMPGMLAPQGSGGFMQPFNPVPAPMVPNPGALTSYGSGQMRQAPRSPPSAGLPPRSPGVVSGVKVRVSIL